MAQFRFKKTDQIGAASAEQDAEFLESCFVDTGDLDLVRGTADHRVIVLGRTGSGKSALLRKLKEQTPEDTVEISPDNLALAYVSNSTILRFFAELGVNLDPFFKLLWRHVFVVEILSHHMEHEGEATKSLVDKLCSMFASSSRQDREMQEAIDYLTKWGKSFWLDTEYRVKEITETLESALGAQAEASVGLSGAKLAGQG